MLCYCSEKQDCEVIVERNVANTLKFFKKKHFGGKRLTVGAIIETMEEIQDH